MKELKTKVTLRNDTAENWELHKDVVLLRGEVGIVIDENAMKIGDGVTAWENLPYFGGAEAHHFEVESDEALAQISTEDLEVGDTAVVKKTISGDKISYTAYVWNGSAWAACDGNYNAENVYFDEDLMVTKEIGYITLKNGQATVPSTGKNLKEVFEAIFVKESNPGTTQPSVSVSMPQAKAYEVGTKVTPTYSATFNAGSYSYGPATGVTVESWEVSDTAGATASAASGSFSELTVADNTNYKITAKATHTAGAVPVTNKNNPYEAGKIAAGSKSATTSAITGYRSYFYGVLDDTVELTSAIVREKLTNGGAYNGSKTFTLSGSATAKRIVIAIPGNSTRGGLKEVILTSAMNTPITELYTKTVGAVNVEGVNGADAIAYTTYVYQPASIDAGEVHKITLA